MEKARSSESELRRHHQGLERRLDDAVRRALIADAKCKVAEDSLAREKRYFAGETQSNEAELQATIKKMEDMKARENRFKSTIKSNDEMIRARTKMVKQTKLLCTVLTFKLGVMRWMVRSCRTALVDYQRDVVIPL